MKDTQEYSDKVYGYLKRIEAQEGFSPKFGGVSLSNSAKRWLCWTYIPGTPHIDSISSPHEIHAFAIRIVDAIEAETDWRFHRGWLRKYNPGHCVFWRAERVDPSGQIERATSIETDEVLSLLDAIAQVLEELADL